ncbi:head GIN domain-containing protein [Danxiaibacter flavus]|uniref:Head GIN domain-containing protein n=1 Tax=Danxiaibacter flavus TaxID=3049108 RepID=A0ABV3ZPG0_9BACT|nr:head GIN domain-containing protein [Chitinophagaceae bacterium DXS]
MKKFLILTGLLFLSIMVLKAQNLVYDPNASIRTVDKFNGVSVGGGINLYLSQGKEQGVAVSAGEDKFTAKIKTEVKNGVLKIYLENGFWNGWSWGNKKIKAYVTVTDLNFLDLSGGSVGKIADPINVNNLKMELSGGSIAEGKFTGNSLNIDLSGGSIAKLDGAFDAASIEASGGSIFKDFAIAVNNCNVDASGGSVINITINKALKADASGGSIIHYKGTGVIMSVDASGGSSIKKQD